MQDNEKKPALRFKGFTDPWEQRKLGEICDFITKGATPTTYGFSWQPDGVPFFRNDSIKDNVFVFGEFSYISEAANEVLKRSEVHGNDILIAITGDIGKVGIIPDTVEKANINQHIARVRIRKEALPYFVYQYLASDDTQKEYQKIKTGLSMPQLSLEQVRDIVVKIPEFNEQGKIADCLRRIDTLITLHQRKYEKLVNIKKSMLDKMFPQNGASVPEIRFKGFTDSWEQRKLGDITVELSEYATQELGLPLLTSSRSGLMYQDEYRDSRTTKSTETLFSVVPVGTCTYRHMSDDDVFHMNINTLEKGLVSREYPVFEASKGNNLEFLVQHINSSEEFKAFCAEQKKGGTRTRLYYNTLCQFTVRVPALKEQAQISQCLKKLDTLITLHQRKLEKLQNIKKSCLEKMFV